MNKHPLPLPLLRHCSSECGREMQGEDKGKSLKGFCIDFCTSRMRFRTLSTINTESWADLRGRSHIPRSESCCLALSCTVPPGAKRVTSACDSKREPSPFTQYWGDPAPFLAPTQHLGTLWPRQGGIQGPEAPLGLAAHEIQECGVLDHDFWKSEFRLCPASSDIKSFSWGSRIWRWSGYRGSRGGAAGSS